MSGALATHRPGNRTTGEITGIGHYLTPGGVYKNGRCVEWVIHYRPTYRHVLDYSPEMHRPSKHARGRTRPRSRAERTRMAGIMRRAVQARKSMTVDINRFGVIFDEVPV